MITAHSRYRATKEWKVFRASLLLVREHRCACCGIPKKPKALQLHHLDPKNYTNLDPKMFVFLCSDCHTLVEKMAKRFRGKNAHTILNPEKWRDLLEAFFPH